MVAADKYPKKIFIYAGFLPLKLDSGADIRLHTNIRAYLDLGYDVEVVYVGKSPPPRWPEYPGVKWRYLPVPNARPTLGEHLSYYLGFPIGKILNFRYEARKSIQNDMRILTKSNPQALFQFEYFYTACALINFPGFQTIFSSYDLETVRKQIVAEFRGKKRKFLRLDDIYLIKAERLVVTQSKLVLAIATHEADHMRNNWGCDHVEVFPMSWPNELAVIRNRKWLEDGKLRLIHLGKIDTILSFNSLQFLFTEVFPRLGKSVLQNIEMDVIGKIPESDGSRKILDMAKKYPQVKFVGYQPDTRLLYSESDVQVVGATSATGLRTRIIESFVFGIPVISTIIGAEGVEGLNTGKNILLANNAETFARHLTYVYENPEALPQLAKAGRETYDRYYSRKVAAEKLSEVLHRYIYKDKEVR